MKMQLCNEKCVLLLGGNSDIGSATAKQLSQLGYTIIITSHKNLKNAEQLIEYINMNGGKALNIEANLQESDNIVSIFKQIDELHLTLFGLINLAAIDIGKKTITEISYDEILQTFHINTLAQIISTQEAIKRMQPAKKGAIVNISSECATSGGYLRSCYAASKAAIEAFTKSVAKEVAKDNIRINAISPGTILTKMTSNQHRNFDEHPLKRAGKPEEIAEIITQLIHINNPYLTGTIIRAHGGKQ